LDVQVSVALAFAAGFVSFLSPCILPVVPGYVGFVSALTLDELGGASPARARRGAVMHSVLFMVGFGLVFLSLGLVATAVGPPIARSLPWIHRAGGVSLAIYGAYLLGAFRLFTFEQALLSPWATATARAAGAIAIGVAFGAGWTPCIGPVFGSILLYVTREPTMIEGAVLLAMYGLGLSVPFVLTSVGLNWPLAGSRSVGNWVVPLRRLAGGALAALGIAMVTGYFARWTAFLAGLGQLINLELS
jgi:cytochrome c-type biogenesis protein